MNLYYLVNQIKRNLLQNIRHEEKRAVLFFYKVNNRRLIIKLLVRTPNHPLPAKTHNVALLNCNYDVMLFTMCWSEVPLKREYINFRWQKSPSNRQFNSMTLNSPEVNKVTHSGSVTTMVMCLQFYLRLMSAISNHSTA